MALKQRRTFQQILAQERPQIARELEMKARIASKVAKVQPNRSATLYCLKNRAVRELFRVPGHMPLIRDAWTTQQGILLSIKLPRTDSWLHFPFDELHTAARQFFGPWAARRASEKRWYPTRSTYLLVNRRSIAPQPRSAQ